MIQKKTLCIFAVVLLMSVVCSGCTTTAKATTAQATDPATKDWTLTLNGTTQKVIRMDDLRRFPAVTGHGYAVSTTGIRFGPYICKGVDIRDLIADMGGMGQNDQVWISAPDGYMWVFDAGQVGGKGFVTFNADLKEIPSPQLRIILMYQQDNKEVSYDDGGPVRIAIISEQPGVVTEGSAWVKWVNRIEIHRK